jgi:hypothetical protein
LKISYTSKNFVAYIEDLVGPTPYYKTTDSRNKLDVCFTKALNDLNKMDDLCFNQYVLCKLLAWSHTQFPPTPLVDSRGSLLHQLPRGDEGRGP